MLLLISPPLLLMGLGCLLGAPTSREVYRMPQGALKALSDRGTVVLEAAMTGALSALDRASFERSQAEAGCRGCVPCLFQDCGQLTGSCSSPASALSEPGCDVISKAHKLQDEGERSWALSQACAYYQHRCLGDDLNKESCIRIMGESCSARVLQCSLLNTMQDLEPATQMHTQAVCGQRSPTMQNASQPGYRVVGGSPAPPGSWPWLVNLQLDGELMCGGVLVDSSWVVTAAHCFLGSHSDNDWTAVVGDFDTTKVDPDEQLLKVNRIIPHPKFNAKTFNNDIALVELTSPVILSNRVTPVCLPSGTEPPTGSSCLVAGWGSLYMNGPFADVVMEARVPLLPQSTCKQALGKDVVTNTMLCAGYLSGGVDSCKGDSGGPLIYQDQLSGRFQLYGITSWGDGCGDKGKPGVYTRVSAFSDWIQVEMQKSIGSREPTCLELLKTTELTEEEQKAEFSSLCHVYTMTCPPGQSTGSCSRVAEDDCLTRFKKCQLRSFLQTLLDLLQRAEDYIRDRVDLTFFTQTLPQLVEHVYSAALTRARRRRDLGPSHGLTQIKDQLGGAGVPTDRSPSPVPPAVFTGVGPTVDDWEEYLWDMAEDADKQQPGESDIDDSFSQMKDSSVHQLEGEYRAVISALRSKLDLRAPPPILHLDILEESPKRLPTSSTEGAPHASSSSSSSSSSFEEFHHPWRLKALSVDEVQTLGTQDEAGTEEPPGETSSAGGASAEFTPGDGTKSMPPATGGAKAETTSDPGQSSSNLSFRRKYRSLLRKRQISGGGGKICPRVRESSQRVSRLRDSYSWILSVPSKNLRMTFQEVLVDLSSKNDRGLYQARIRAVVGGRPLTFYSLMGLENESFYRSAPRIIALALEVLKKT